MQKWEYKKQYANWDKQDDIISALGEQGWEMVTVQVADLKDEWGFYFWFKRPK
jgi:hypothetical protein